MHTFCNVVQSSTTEEHQLRTGSNWLAKRRLAKATLYGSERLRYKMIPPVQLEMNVSLEVSWTQLTPNPLTINLVTEQELKYYGLFEDRRNIEISDKD